MNFISFEPIILIIYISMLIIMITVNYKYVSSHIYEL